ncbi:hypothetical protein pdam_00016399 [Pocillopora damicornis]|uniref:Uncharacterized protein n=1 Tax=Pocillopora damicornis TaxID=46731 RepID=A0A3M6URM5_POCDA|nr:hypothetical protein pdam_00016399 [Pocillopora damicornis]
MIAAEYGKVQALHLRATKALLTEYFLSELTLNPKPRMVKPPYDDTAPWTYRDRLFPSQRIGKNTGNNLTDCFNANVMLANFLEGSKESSFARTQTFHGQAVVTFQLQSQDRGTLVFTMDVKEVPKSRTSIKFQLSNDYFLNKKMYLRLLVTYEN